MKRLLIVLFLIMPAFAWADDKPPATPPRTIDMTVVLTDVHGKPLPDVSAATPADPQCEKCGPLTLGAVCAAALLADRGKDEPNLTSIEKARRGALAMRILDNKDAVLTSAQTAEIVKLLNIWSSLVIARAVPLLDPAIDLTTLGK